MAGEAESLSRPVDPADHLPLAMWVAHRETIACPWLRQDAAAEAALALVQAARTWMPGGSTWGAYAKVRCQWAVRGMLKLLRWDVVQHTTRRSKIPATQAAQIAAHVPGLRLGDFAYPHLTTTSGYGEVSSGTATIGETIPDSRPGPDELLARAALWDRVGAELAHFEPRDAELVRLWLENQVDGGGPLTFGQLGQRHGISGERARQIVHKGLGKLRFRLREYDGR